MATVEQQDGALKVIVNLVRTIALKRAIAAVDDDPHLNFWRVIQGNGMDMAAIEWCKLFGSDDEAHQQAAGSRSGTRRRSPRSQSASASPPIRFRRCDGLASSSHPAKRAPDAERNTTAFPSKGTHQGPGVPAAPPRASGIP